MLSLWNLYTVYITYTTYLFCTIRQHKFNPSIMNDFVNDRYAYWENTISLILKSEQRSVIAFFSIENHLFQSEESQNCL